jgi:hypothetical protein
LVDQNPSRRHIDATHKNPLISRPCRRLHVKKLLRRCSDNEEVFAGGIIFFFSTLGFFAGYIFTRMYFARAFARSDSESSTTRDLNALASSPTPTGEHPDAEHALRQLAENSMNIPLAGHSAMAATAVTKGALLLGNTERAMQAATIALSQNPNDPRARLDFAVAFDRMGGSSEAVLAAIDNVRNAIQPSLDPAIKEDLYNSMVYLSLYQDPPEGFQKSHSPCQRILGCWRRPLSFDLHPSGVRLCPAL